MQCHTCLPWQWGFKALCRLRVSSGHFPMSLSLLPALGRTLCLSFPQLLPVNRGYKGGFVPKDQGQAFAGEGETRQAGDQRKGSCCPCSDTSSSSAKVGNSLGRGFSPNLSMRVMCWRPEPKSDPNPSAPSTEGPRLGLELFSMSWREKGMLRIRLGRSGLVWSLWQGSRGWSQAGDQCPVCSLAENPPNPPGRRILQTPVLLTEPGPSFCFGRALGMFSL